MSSFTVQIEGMSCASCVGRVEKALRALPGVTEASVNLASESARIDSGDATAAQVADALQDAGYPAVTESVRLDVEGMTCASCVARVERALQAVPGVIAASANLASETATVRYLAGAATPAGLAAAATAAGYPARPGADAASPRPDRKAAEAETLRRDTLIALALTLPVFILAMGSHLVPGAHALIARTIGHQASWLIQFALTTAVLAWPGARFFRLGVPSLFKGAPDMNALVALGTAAAWGFSTLATFAPGVLPAGTAEVYFEAAAVIVTLILLGRWLEARAKGRTGAAIRKLVGLRPDTARIDRDGVISEVPIDTLQIGDILQLRPGERVPTDAQVISGSSNVDESMITGEPIPVAKSAGAQVTGGTLNGNGALSLRVTAVGADTMLARIIRMVEDAQGAKLPIQGLVDRITAVFVPAVLGVAVLTVAAWLAVGPAPALSHALVAGVAVLIVACPCAMGLATPTSIMVGTGRAADLGVLFRKGDALQGLQGVGTIAFDKTGTLTMGRPDLTDLATAPGWEEGAALRLIAAVEAASEHPIATAILRGAEARGLDIPKAEGFGAITGMGAGAQVEGHRVLVGADRLMAREGIALGALAETGAALAGQGRTPLYAAVDGQAAAVLAVADKLKPTTKPAIAALHDLGLRVAMITGDNAATARAIAAELGIDTVVAEVLPDGKVAALRDLAADGTRLAFVGDGINDAPALAAADVGIAIGTGTDVAIEAADVVLMSGALAGVVNAVDISRHTMRNIRQNLFWAFGYNALLIPVAAGVLYPATGLMLSPMLAAGAMAFSSVFVLGNALRLRGLRPALQDTAAA